MKQFDCDVYLDLMPLVKDGAASEASCMALKEHLEVCPSCRHQYDAFPQEPQEDAAQEETFWTVQKKLKRRAFLGIAGCLVFMLIPIVLICILCGNPISQFIIGRQAEDYIRQQYPGNDFIISEPQYSMKSLGYTVRVESQASRDTYFVLNYGYFGGDCWDGYEDFVLSGTNTFHRICEDVGALLGPVVQEFEIASIGLNSDWPSIYDEFGYPFEAPEELKIGELEIDGNYDPLKLSAQYGHVEIHREVSKVSAEEIADILTQVYEELCAQGIAVRTLDVTIYSQESAMTVAGFLFQDIPSEDLVDKVQQQADAYAQFSKEYEDWILKKNQ